MAHTATIDAAVYELRGGRVRVDGTAYEISGGRSRREGTICDLGFETVHPVLEKNDWATISRVSQQGLAASVWSVGDTKSVHLLGAVGLSDPVTFDGTYHAFILGFDHNEKWESTGIHLGLFAADRETPLCLTDSHYGADAADGQLWFGINHSQDTAASSGGWHKSYMRYGLLGGTDNATITVPTAACVETPRAYSLMAALPEALRSVLQVMVKYTATIPRAAETGASTVSATLEYLTLPAAYEVSGRRSALHPAEEYSYQKQYDYFAQGVFGGSVADQGGNAGRYFWTRTINRSDRTVYQLYASPTDTIEQSMTCSYGILAVCKV